MSARKAAKRRRNDADSVVDSAQKAGKRRRSDADSDCDSELNDSHQLDTLVAMLTDRKKREGRKADKIIKAAKDNLERDMRQREVTEVKAFQVCMKEFRSLKSQAKEILQDIGKKHQVKATVLKRARLESKKFAERDQQLKERDQHNKTSYSADKKQVEKQIEKFDRQSKQQNEFELENNAKSENERLHKMVRTCLTSAFQYA